MRISDWSSDVCTSDLLHAPGVAEASGALRGRDGTGPAQAHTGEAMRGRRRGASAPLLFSPCRKAPTPGEVTEKGGSGGPRRVSTLAQCDAIGVAMGRAASPGHWRTEERRVGKGGG